MTPTISSANSRTQSSISVNGQAWRWLTAIAVFGTAFLTYYSNTHLFASNVIAVMSANYPTLLTPSGYASVIWGPIFFSLALYAGWQLLPATHRLVLPDAVAKPLALACLATGAWLVLLAHELILPSLGVMLFILVCLVVAYGRVRRQVSAKEVPALVSVPFSLYLGWIAFSVIVNVTIVLRELGWQPNEGVSLFLTVVLLVGLVVLALIISHEFQDMVFPQVVAWALVGIWAARLSEMPALGWAALAGATVAAIGGFALSRLGGRKTPWQLRDDAAAIAEAEIAAWKAIQAGK
jgi:hypothetical protein